MKKDLILKIVLVIILALAAGVYFTIHKSYLDRDVTGFDIFFIYKEGERIISGENPYTRIIGGSMRENDKYPTYLPGFYLFAGLTRAMGLKEFSRWVIFWRWLSFFINFGLTGFIFYWINKKRGMILATAAAVIWLLNRWSLYITLSAHIDFLAILLLVLSLYFLPKKTYLACFLFSISLLVKQIGIFLFPLYLIWLYRIFKEKGLDKALVGLLWIIGPSLLISLPFILWSPEGFFRCILFSVTRNPEYNQLLSIPLDRVLDLVGFPAKIPMFTLMALIYFADYRGKTGVITSSLMIMLVFVLFHSVLFAQYLVWLIAMILLVMVDYRLYKPSPDIENEVNSELKAGGVTAC